MSPTRTDQRVVEVRLRYRPVGDVLTVSVCSGLPDGPRFQTEPDDHTIIEWLRMPDGSTCMAAVQIIGPGPTNSPGRGPLIDYLHESLRATALELISPGRSHNHHPSTHSPTRSTDSRETTVLTTADAVFP